MRTQGFGYLLPVAVIVLFTTIASAHGDEESSARFSNLEILFTALTLSLVGFLLTATKYAEKMTVFSASTFSFALYTGSVHALLGLNDGILLLGGGGVLSLLFASVIFTFSNSKLKLARIALALVSIIMFFAYFVSNHDIHAILEDYLGITTKISEIYVIIGLLIHVKNLILRKNKVKSGIIQRSVLTPTLEVDALCLAMQLPCFKSNFFQILSDRLFSL